MELLDTLPLREDLMAEDSHKRALNASQEFSSKRCKIDDDGHTMDGTPLGLNLRDDYIEIDEIKRRPLPREDGLPWRFYEQTTAAKAKRPYGKTYLEDQAERHKILSANKNYRFMKDLAGALRKELTDIMEPEDDSRLARERETERLKITLELERTRIDMEKKYDLVQKLKEMVKSEEETYNALLKREPPHYLTLLSRYLVDNTELPGTMLNQEYGFLNLVDLVNTYSENKEKRDEITRRILNELFSVSEQETLKGNEDFFFYLYVYYRDFLDNQRPSLADSLKIKIHYGLNNYTNLTGETLESAPIKVEGVESDELEMDQIATALNTSNPLRLLADFDRQMKHISHVDWSLYKRDRTETINMDYFDELSITKDLEEEMARKGAAARYGQDYVKRVIAYLYGTEIEREKITSGMNGFNPLSGDPRDGHPPDIDRLIRLQFPLYDSELKPLEDVEVLLISHFLFLFFQEVPWPEILTLLFPEKANLILMIESIMSLMSGIINTVFRFYKALIALYLRRVAATLESLIVLPPTLQRLLAPENEPVTLAEAVTLFDTLNREMSNISVQDIVTDNRFLEYLATGSDAFLKYQFESPSATIRIKPVNLVTNTEYPALILHNLMRAYAAYLKEYITVSKENIARMRAAIEKAQKKIAEVVGDESYTVTDNALDYKQRKAFTTRPENSGFIKINAEVDSMLKLTYNLVMDYAPNLRDLPLEAFQSDSAYESGLAIDFINLIAVIDADNEYTRPDGYRSSDQYRKILRDKQSKMARMRRYMWSRNNFTREYKIAKNIDNVPIFATRQMPCYQRETRLIF